MTMERRLRGILHSQVPLYREEVFEVSPQLPAHSPSLQSQTPGRSGRQPRPQQNHLPTVTASDEGGSGGDQGNLDKP